MILSLSKYFNQNAEFMSQKLGVPIVEWLTPGATHYVFGAHDFAADILAFQATYPGTKLVIFQSENIKSPFFTKQYIQLLRQNEVWQYSPMIARYCEKKWSIPCRSYFSFDYLEPDTEYPDKGMHDIVFFGTLTKRRHDILREIQHIFGNKYTLSFFVDVFNRDIDIILSRTKCVLNISAYDDNALETHRINKCLVHGVQVVSNPSADREMNRKYAEKIIFTKGRHVGDYISTLSKLFPAH